MADAVGRELEDFVDDAVQKAFNLWNAASDPIEAVLVHYSDAVVIFAALTALGPLVILFLVTTFRALRRLGGFLALSLGLLVAGAAATLVMTDGPARVFIIGAPENASAVWLVVRPAVKKVLVDEADYIVAGAAMITLGPMTVLTVAVVLRFMLSFTAKTEAPLRTREAKLKITPSSAVQMPPSSAVQTGVPRMATGLVASLRPQDRTTRPVTLTDPLPADGPRSNREAEVQRPAQQVLNPGKGSGNRAPQLELVPEQGRAPPGKGGGKGAMAEAGNFKCPVCGVGGLPTLQRAAQHCGPTPSYAPALSYPRASPSASTSFLPSATPSESYTPSPSVSQGGYVCPTCGMGSLPSIHHAMKHCSKGGT